MGLRLKSPDMSMLGAIFKTKKYYNAKVIKQTKKVIELMKQGYDCKKRRYSGYCIIKNDDYIFVGTLTIDKLKSLNILTQHNTLTN